jgi:hypothetical protein
MGAQGREGDRSVHADHLQAPNARRAGPDKQPDADQHDQTFTRFVYRPNWFVLSQTDGQEVPAPAIPAWDQSRALESLGIVEEPFR